MLVYRWYNEYGSYVGITKYDAMKRFREHLYESKNGSNSKFHKAIAKYGIDGLKLQILAEDIEDFDELNRLEIFYVEKFNSYNNGWNMTLGGGLLSSSTKGRSYDEIYGEQLSKLKRDKMSIAKRKQMLSDDEERFRLSKNNHWKDLGIVNDWGQKGRIINDDIKEKISRSLKTTYNNSTAEEISERYKNNRLNNPMKGRTHTDETKKLQSERMKIKVKCPHCGKDGNKAIMKRWHFDNCKLKEINNESKISQIKR